MVLRDVRILDSVTQIRGGDHTVVLAASHGGEYAGHLAVKSGATGVILHDAGIGKNEAGIASLSTLEDRGIAGATVDHRSARIGDGIDCARNGVISAVNDTAAERGCEVRVPAIECAVAMHRATPAAFDDDAEASVDAAMPPGPRFREGTEGTRVTRLEAGDPPVWGLDSLSLIDERHAGTIAITGSHGELLAGERDGETYLPTDVAGATFFDAGVGKDAAGIGRLETLASRGIPAAAVDVDTAHIGDARAAWRTGRFSHVNDVAASLGLEPGDSCRAFVAAIRQCRTDECL